MGGPWGEFRRASYAVYPFRFLTPKLRPDHLVHQVGDQETSNYGRAEETLVEKVDSAGCKEEDDEKENASIKEGCHGDLTRSEQGISITPIRYPLRV